MVSNELYPNFHFIQKAFAERVIHSTCNETLTSVIRLKHNSIRRQKYSDVSYLYQSNLNKQLDAFSASKTNPLKELYQNFLFFSLLFWDDNNIPFLSEVYKNSKPKMIMKRMYVEQGLGKSFTIYFDNKSKHGLSSQLTTLSSIASIVNIILFSESPNGLLRQIDRSHWWDGSGCWVFYSSEIRRK